MNDLTNRFIDVYNTLLAQEKVANASDFAKKISVSSSLITEILKKRTNVGITPLQNAVIYFNLDANYLLTGVESTFHNQETLSTGAQPAPTACPACQQKERTIAQLNKLIEHQEKLITQLQSAPAAQNPPYSQTA